MSSLKTQQEYTIIAKYSQYNKEKGRRETWEEINKNRVFPMHRKKYLDNKEYASKEDRQKVSNYIDIAETAIIEQKAIGSQRAAQFGGQWIEKNNTRMYNCTFSYLDRESFFSEAMFLLFAGAGVGFSVQKHHVAKLPKIGPRIKGTKAFVVPDTTEGQSDAIGIVVNSFFTNSSVFSEYNGHRVEFDYSEIRPEGSLLSVGAKAPGPDGIKRAIENITAIMERLVVHTDTLSSIDAYDIVCYAADAVVSGGIRRAALIALFSLDDEEMLYSKIGNWSSENPQRGRSNNSAMLLRDSTSYEDFYRISQLNKEWGEPGYYWSDNTEIGPNPCVEISFYPVSPVNQKTGWAMCNLSEINGRLVTDEKSFLEAAKAAAIIGTLQAGYTNFSYLPEETKHIVEYEALLGVSITGMQDSPEILFDPALQRNAVEVIRETNKDLAAAIGINYASRLTAIKPSGCRVGEGTVITDQGIYTLSEIKSMSSRAEMPRWFNIDKPLTHGDKKITRFFDNDISPTMQLTFDNGLTAQSTYNHKWDVVGYGFKEAQNIAKGDKIVTAFNTYRNHTENDLPVGQVLMNKNLAWLTGYLMRTLTFNKFKDNERGNNYLIHAPAADHRVLLKIETILLESFGITSSWQPRMLDMRVSTFIRNEKFDSFMKAISSAASVDLKDSWVPLIIRLSSANHILAYLAGMIDRVAYYFYKQYDYREQYLYIGVMDSIDTTQSLLEVMMAIGVFPKVIHKIKTKHILFESYASRAIFVELAGHISSRYANIGTHNYRQMEADYLTVTESVKKADAHTYDVEVPLDNWYYGGGLKSHNSASLALGTASGIHPHQARRYFRRVQANRNEVPLKYFKGINPLAVEKSVWDSSGKTDVITFLVEVEDKANTKRTVSGLELLKQIKSTQQNWVIAGTNPERIRIDGLVNNVSNTVHLKPEEWDIAVSYIYENRQYFAGISLFPESGELDYPQAPMCEVLTGQELYEKYQDGAIFASGLIVEGLSLYGNDLWVACSALLYPPLKENDTSSPTQRVWMDKAVSYAVKYFGGDIKTMTYCLKDVHNLKLWNDLQRSWKDVDWSLLAEGQETVIEHESNMACAGGACEMPSEYLETNRKTAINLLDNNLEKL